MYDVVSGAITLRSRYEMVARGLLPVPAISALPSAHTLRHFFINGFLIPRLLHRHLLRRYPQSYLPLNLQEAIVLRIPVGASAKRSEARFNPPRLSPQGSGAKRVSIPRLLSRLGMSPRCLLNQASASCVVSLASTT